MQEIVNLPRLGDTVDEVLLLEWIVEVGQTVAKGDPLVLVETDKTEVEVEAPVDGTILEISAQVDTEVETGAPLCVIESSDDSGSG
jgi:pyruvate/2-oxoglutarate dehydrogenase complex dihydrolipoamide acyltransferase (E2) component